MHMMIADKKHREKDRWEQHQNWLVYCDSVLYFYLLSTLVVLQLRGTFDIKF